jgi:D-xylose transport system substrate-binding protein
MNRACLFKNTIPHEQYQHASCIRPLKNNFVRMKAFKFIVLSVILGCLVSSCSTKRSKAKVGFLIRGFIIERCIKERDFFVERTNQLGAEAIIADAQENDQLQIEQGLQMLEKGIDVLVIFPVNLNTSAAIIRAAHDKGVPTIAYESLIQNSQLDYYISADNRKGGVLMAQHMVKMVPQGNYVIIGGDKSDRNAVLIKQGNYDIINPYVKQGKIKIMYDIYADWTAEEGYREMEKILKLSGTIPDAILSSNDGMSTGIIKALDEYGLAGRIPVTGLDAELSACQRIVNGTQSVTIYKSFKKQAYAAAEMAYKLTLGQKPETNTEVFNGKKNVPTYLIDPVAVDKNNMKGIIINSNVYSEQQVYSSK